MMKTRTLMIMFLAMAVAVSTALCTVGCGSNDNPPESNPTSELPDESSGGGGQSSPTEEKKEVTVRFLVDGEVYQEITGLEGARITLPQKQPTKDHMTFVKWEGYTNGTRFTENRDYNAVFEDVIYTVKFTDGNTTVKTVEGKYGDTFEAPENLADKPGYIFMGWEGFDATNLAIGGNAEYAANWLKMNVSYSAEGTYDNTVLTKDSMFATSEAVAKFDLVQNTENAADEAKKFEVSLAHDGEYLYVYIYSEDNDQNDDDRLSFYIVKNGQTTTTLIETKPNLADPYTKGKDACSLINAGKVEGGYALKAKIDLSSLEISEQTLRFGVRFIDMNNKVVYLSKGATADNGATKVDNAANLPVWEIAGDISIDGDDSEWENIVKTDIPASGFTSWVGSVPADFAIKAAFKADAKNLYARIEVKDSILVAGTDEGKNDGSKYDGDAMQIAFNAGNGRFFYSFDYRGDGNQGYIICQNGVTNENVTLVGAYLYTKNVEGGWAAELSIPLSTILGDTFTFNAENPINLKVLVCYIDRDEGEGAVTGAYGTFCDFEAWGDEDGMPLTLKADGTYQLTIPSKEPIQPVQPATPVGIAPVAYVENATFDATNLTKDALFANATDITKFQKVEGSGDFSYVLNLVHDNNYLYVYIFSADTAQNDTDRVTFYFVKKGETKTLCVETYPNKADPYKTNKDACAAIIAGKVEGGYALKAKIALADIEIKEGGKINFGVRLINNDNNANTIYLSDGATADNGATKVDNAANLPEYTLTDYRSTTTEE